MSRDTASQTWCLQTVRNIFCTLPWESKHAEARTLRPYRRSNQIYNAVDFCELLEQRAPLGGAEPRDGDCVEQRVGR